MLISSTSFYIFSLILSFSFLSLNFLWKQSTVDFLSVRNKLKCYTSLIQYCLEQEPNTQTQMKAYCRRCTFLLPFFMSFLIQSSVEYPSIIFNSDFSDANFHHFTIHIIKSMYRCEYDLLLFFAITNYWNPSNMLYHVNPRQSKLLANLSVWCYVVFFHPHSNVYCHVISRSTKNKHWNVNTSFT